MDAGELDADPTGLRSEAALPRFAVVDVETSGLSTRWHRLLQVAVVTVDDGDVVDEWSSLVRLRWPWQRVGPRRVHGLERAALRAAPPADIVMRELAQRLRGAVFTAHNAPFDWAFLERTARRNGVRLEPVGRLCTLRLSRRLDPDHERSHRLADVCLRYDISNERPHDARFDALATAQVLPHLLAAHDVRSAADLTDLFEP